jgi:hypothetical protein
VDFITNINMADVRTCEVGATLAPLIVGVEKDLPQYFRSVHLKLCEELVCGL